MEANVYFWVYILRDNERLYIGLTAEVDEIENEANSKGCKMVYMRKFKNLAEAKGHEFFISHLKPMELVRYVKSWQECPSMKS